MGVGSKYLFCLKTLSGWTIAKYLSIVTDIVTNTEPTLAILQRPNPIGKMKGEYEWKVANEVTYYWSN